MNTVSLTSLMEINPICDTRQTWQQIHKKKRQGYQKPNLFMRPHFVIKEN